VFGAYELRFRISEKIRDDMAVARSYLQRTSLHGLFSPA
jgi:hypothetical protein